MKIAISSFSIVPDLSLSNSAKQASKIKASKLGEEKKFFGLF